MATTRRIGAYVDTETLAGASTPGPPSTRWHIAGITEKGPLNSQGLVIGSIAEFAAIYGGRTTWTADTFNAVETHFEEGGSEVVVSRVVGPAATRGSVQLADSLGVNTIQIQTIDPGPHSGAYEVVVENHTDGTFSVIVENETGRAMDAFRNAESVTDLIDLAANAQNVTVTNLGSTSVGAAANPVEGRFPMVAGTDDREAIETQHYVDALNAAGDVAPGGAVSIPGMPADLIAAGLLAHAKAYRKQALMDTARGSDYAAALNTGDVLAGTANARHGALFYPWINIPDGTRTRKAPPCAFAAAARARAHREVGYWEAAAGDRSLTRWPVRPVDRVDVNRNNELASHYVNGIVSTTGAVERIRLYGWSTLSTIEEEASIAHQDTLNNIACDVQEALEPYVFQINDGRGILKSRIEGSVRGVLEPLVRANAVYARVVNGQQLDPGYRVVVDEAPSTYQGQNSTELRVTVAVRLSYTAELIVVSVSKVALTSAV